jgi:hypothetical protein
MPFKDEHHRVPVDEYYVAPKVQQSAFWKYPKNDGADPS